MAEGGDPRLEMPEVLRAQAGDRPRPGGGDPTARRVNMAETAKAWGMALDLVFTAVGGFVLGYLFDLWRGTGPWGAVIGLALGFVTAAVRLVRTTIRQETARKNRRG